MPVPQLFFINGFTVNGSNIDDYSPLTFTSRKDRLNFKGILTTPIVGITRAGKERTFDNHLIRLLVTLNLFIENDDTDTLNTVVLDKQIATISHNPAFNKPTTFEVPLNPFRNEEVEFSNLKFGTYYLNVEVEIVFEVAPDVDTVKLPQTMKIFSNNLAGRFNTSLDVISGE